MAKQVRRVVTGHDPDGKAIVISDGPAPFVHVNAVNPEWYSTDIWRTRETPARIARAAEEPTLGPRRQPVIIELLAPNGRPVQTTTDLRSFWERTYPEVRRELRGRYPKHPWPEDPWTAEPTHRTTRRR